MSNWTEDEYLDYQRRKGYLPPPNKKPPKYRNTKTTVDGICFDSQKEANYYSELKIRLMAGEISGFCRQPEFILQAGCEYLKPVIYIADFIVFYPSGSAEIIDTKGFLTETYKLKRKMFVNRFPLLTIKEVF